MTTRSPYHNAHSPIAPLRTARATSIGTALATALATPLALALVLSMGLGAATAQASAPGALNSARAVRSAGCSGRPGTHVPVRGNALLDNAAARWARGLTLSVAVELSGYRADQTSALHVRGTASLGSALARNLCGPLLDPANEDIGSVQSGQDTWLIVAAPFVPPDPNEAQGVAYQVLRLVNGARAIPRLCGRSSFQPAPALRLEAALNSAAMGHAQDMLRFGYFDHTGHDGSSPGTRAAASGYHYRLVGENIAEGPQSPQEVVQGWLDSPGHCQNIMNPHFTDMGLAFAANTLGRPRIEWVQEFGATR
jgi:uncharacterized protein YkwD